MKTSTIFDNPKILRQTGNNFDSSSIELVDEIASQLIDIMDSNHWAGISPQNVLNPEGIKAKDTFYKQIIILKDFNGVENFQILNPYYEVLSQDSDLMLEGCGSIETLDHNPFEILNLIPKKIKVTGFSSDFEPLEFILEGKSLEEQEQIAYIMHEINHVHGILISDGGIIRELVKGNMELYHKTQRLYQDLIPSFLEFNGNGYVIHNLGNKGIHNSCEKSGKNKTWENILPFHFDLDDGFDLMRSTIYKKGKKYNISICNKCMM